MTSTNEAGVEFEHMFISVRSAHLMYQFQNSEAWTTFKDLLINSLDHFNDEMEKKGSEYILFEAFDPADNTKLSEMYTMRIAKKKNGKPDLDYPCKHY